MVKVLRSALRQIRRGDSILTVDGKVVNDFLDLYYHAAGFGPIALKIRQRGSNRTLTIRTRLLDRTARLEVQSPPFRTCNNNCFYCFVDQLPLGLRKEVYFEDDDYRLSFLYGNFISLTNLRPHDIKRIAALRLSPLYVSVQTTDPGLRRRMFGNRQAGRVVEQLKQLIDAGIKLHAQVVLVPGFNDGPCLETTCQDLARLFPGVASIGVVPAGQTKFRSAPLPALDRHSARAVIQQTTQLREQFRKRFGPGLVYLGDEFFFKSGRALPSARYYDGFPQIGNGIGMARAFLDETRRLRPLPRTKARFLIVTGELARPLLAQLIARLETDRIDLCSVKNRFFGPSVTVSGLLAGQDIRPVLSNRYDRIFLPPNCTNDAGRLIDDFKVEDLDPGRITVAPESLLELTKCLT